MKRKIVHQNAQKAVNIVKSHCFALKSDLLVQDLSRTIILPDGE